MKILQVITSLQIGGAEKLVAEISPMLREKGHEVDVLAFAGTGPNFIHLLEEKGIKVYTFGEHVNVYNPTFIPKLAKMMKGYDIIHTHNTSPQYFAALGSLVNERCHLVTTEHNTYNRRRSIPLFKTIDRWMYSRYEQIICISDQAEVNMRKFLPKTSGIRTIYNGVNVQSFHNAKAIEGMHPKGKTVVVMVAAFRPQKDQKTLIKALTQLPKDKYELWLVGDGELHKELHAYAYRTHPQKSETNGIISYGNIHFFGNRPDVPQILHSADIVVMSSHYEGLSLSSVEGMSVGKPFIASDVDGLREVVDGYGILFPHSDDKVLASIIQQLSDDKAYYQQVAAKCWERAQMFDIHKMVDAYNEVYEGLVKQKDNS